MNSRDEKEKAGKTSIRSYTPNLSEITDIIIIYALSPSFSPRVLGLVEYGDRLPMNPHIFNMRVLSHTEKCGNSHAEGQNIGCPVRSSSISPRSDPILLVIVLADFFHRRCHCFVVCVTGASCSGEFDLCVNDADCCEGLACGTNGVVDRECKSHKILLRFAWKDVACSSALSRSDCFPTA